jgi:hypothetical protein
MRIWDIPPNKLCRNHLLGEHSELHAIWSIITKEKSGCSHHPEVIRWKGKLKALYLKHEEITTEMKKRGYNHNSYLDINLVKGGDAQEEFVDTINDQITNLKNKQCNYKVLIKV